MTFSAARLYTRIIGCDEGTEGSGCGLIEIVTQKLPARTEKKTRNASVRTADVPTGIRTKHLPYKNIENYAR
jgi:hypothetical protein